MFPARNLSARGRARAAEPRPARLDAAEQQREVGARSIHSAAGVAASTPAALLCTRVDSRLDVRETRRPCDRQGGVTDRFMAELESEPRATPPSDGESVAPAVMPATGASVHEPPTVGCTLFYNQTHQF